MEVTHGYSPNHTSRSWRSFKLKLANVCWPRLRIHILMRKLALLGKLLHSDGVKLSSRVFHTLAVEDVYMISLFEWCQFLESELGTTFTAKCLNDPENSSSIVAEAKEELVKKDWHLILRSINSHSSLKHVSSPAIASSWCKVWAHALDIGVCGTKLMQSLFRVMSRPVFGDWKCPSCDLKIDSSQSYLEHICCHHCLDLDTDDIVYAIEDCGPDLTSFAKTLRCF